MALTKVTSGMRTLATDEVTATEIAAGAVGASEIASTIDLSSKTLTIPASAVTEAMVTAHVTAFDDSKIRNDIATLALHSAIADNKAAHNLSNSFVDQYEDDTGISSETTADRDASGEYMASIIQGSIDSDTLLMMHFDGVDGAESYPDSSSHGRDGSQHGHAHTDTSIKKFGTASLQLDGAGDYLHFDISGGWMNLNSYTDACMELWMYSDSPDSQNRLWGTSQSNVQGYMASASSGGGVDFLMGNGSGWGTYATIPTGNLSDNTWHHIAWVKQGTTVRAYLDGVQKGTGTWQSGDSYINHFYLGKWNYFGNDDDFTGYMDEFRISKVVRYPDGTTFTPPTEAFGSDTVNASGNYTSTAQTANATVSKMGAVILYKDNEGTAALNTDLVLGLSSDNGSNYTTPTLTAGGTFSAGIKIALANNITISNTGTQCKYRINFANQASGSKETQVHGVAMLY